MVQALLARLQRGCPLDEADSPRRRRPLLWVLAVHIPVFAALGLVLADRPGAVLLMLVVQTLCVGAVVLLRRYRPTEESRQETDALERRLADAEIRRRQFTADLLVNLARRNQSLLYRQLDIINQLEQTERDPNVLAGLATLEHLASRVRRNAEGLLVLSGEQPPRVWSSPVPLRDVVRAAIAETRDLDRVVFSVEEKPAVTGHVGADLTHLIAELLENAVRFSPPENAVTIGAQPDPDDPGGQLLTIEDRGVGMPPGDLKAANELLAHPPEVDLSVSQRLGLHVVARLAARHGIAASLVTNPGSGITAVVRLPRGLFHDGRGATAQATARPLPESPARGPKWPQWWTPAGDGASASLEPERPRPEPAAPVHVPGPRADVDPVSGLRRRVPQAHLAPQLRRAVDAPESVPVPVPAQAPKAASALSRHRASTLAAQRSAASEGHGE